MITGSIGMLPSASLNEEGRGTAISRFTKFPAPILWEGELQNPIATICRANDAALTSFGLSAEADAIEFCSEKALDDGYRTGGHRGKG